MNLRTGLQPTKQKKQVTLHMSRILSKAGLHKHNLPSAKHPNRESLCQPQAKHFRNNSYFEKKFMKEILLNQFRAAWNRADWFVPLATAIEDIRPAQAAVKHNPHNHSIEEIVHHLIYWNDLSLNRFKDTGYSFPEISNDETFVNRHALSWQQACVKLQAVHEEWITVLESCNDEKLHATIPSNGKIWNENISNLIGHIAYHTGQIVTLRKEGGFWDANKGVN